MASGMTITYNSGTNHTSERRISEKPVSAVRSVVIAERVNLTAIARARPRSRSNSGRRKAV